MNMKNRILFTLIAAGLIFTGCDADRPETMDTVESPAESANAGQADAFFRAEQNGIIIYEAPESPDFPDAKINLKEPNADKSLKTGKNQFLFEVDNFELGAQTPDAQHLECANSEQGQHIHWILNNEPYAAHYTPNVEKDLKDGKHLLLAFLSRSYHESIKRNNAYTLKQLNVGDIRNAKDFNLNAPHLFYSRPKGEYEGNDAKVLLLDFYLVNANISDGGNKVRVIIDGNTEFILTKWVPYKIEGLGEGEHTIRIQLIDKAGLPVEGPFNDSGERKITLKNVPATDHAHDDHGHEGHQH
jgi:hypothetical protein